MKFVCRGTPRRNEIRGKMKKFLNFEHKKNIFFRRVVIWSELELVEVVCDTPPTFFDGSVVVGVVQQKLGSESFVMFLGGSNT